MAKYKGRTVRLNKPSRGDVKKFKVFVRDNRSGRVKKINFGSKSMSIKKHIPARKRSFLARMGASKGPDYVIKDGKKVPSRKLLSLRKWGASSSADAKRKAKAISKRNKSK